MKKKNQSIVRYKHLFAPYGDELEEVGQYVFDFIHSSKNGLLML